MTEKGKKYVISVEPIEGTVVNFFEKVAKDAEEAKKEKNKKLLKKFIDQERKKVRAGSGDDMFYEQQIIDYIKKQEQLWLDFIDFVKNEVELE